MNTLNKSYSQLIRLPTFKERYEYLKLDGTVGRETFGWDRYLNQKFYASDEWKRFRRDIIIRDMGCDLGLNGYDISGQIIIHHINPIRVNDIISQTELLMNPENSICVSTNTHRAVHYGNFQLADPDPVIRTKGDTCLW